MLVTAYHCLKATLIATHAQVLVMHDGSKLEYDSVPALLARRDGAFRAMVIGAGISHQALGTDPEG